MQGRGRIKYKDGAVGAWENGEAHPSAAKFAVGRIWVPWRRCAIFSNGQIVTVSREATQS